MESEHRKKNIDRWILEEDIPSRAGFKIERTAARYFNPCENMEGEEADAYWEFIYATMMKEHQILLSIPLPEPEYDFWPFEFDEDGHNVSVFNTIDFYRSHPANFDKYHYRLKKIYEKVKDLAITYSCISDEEGRKNIRQRFIDLVEKEFRAEGMMLVETYNKYPQWVYKHKLFGRVEEIIRKIRKCKKIWKKYAHWE